jgi:hypothetical protein
LALVWLRVSPTYELLGWLFGLDKSNAWPNTQDMLEVLETMADFPFDRSGRDRSKLGTAAAGMTAFPAVRVILDAKEQGVRRVTLTPLQAYPIAA